MANEIRIQALLQVTNGEITAKMTDNVSVDQTYPGAYQYSQEINNAAEEDIYIAAVTTPRMLFLQNSDSNSYIDIGPKSGGVMVPLMRLWPGEIAMMPLYPGVTLRARCNDGTGTDAAILTYMITET